MGGLAFSALGLINLKQSIVRPFAMSAVADNTNFLAVSNVDTDKDGLLDADEISTYGTSPFLSDSDSDGIADGKEIESGTNPNCPEGKTCAPIVAPGTSSGNTDTNSISPAPTVTASQLRQQLLKDGVPPESLDKLTDEELMAAYASALRETAATANPSVGSTSTPSPTPTTTTTIPANLTPAQIRELLKKNGVTDQQLSALSDQELLDAYNKTVEQIKK